MSFYKWLFEIVLMMMMVMMTIGRELFGWNHTFPFGFSLLLLAVVDALLGRFDIIFFLLHRDKSTNEKCTNDHLMVDDTHDLMAIMTAAFHFGNGGSHFFHAPQSHKLIRPS